jgi:hypothetical protein
MPKYIKKEKLGKLILPAVLDALMKIQIILFFLIFQILQKLLRNGRSSSGF